MKATGLVRRIDNIGRVAIPNEVRRTLRIKNGDPIDIFTDREGSIIIKKYSPIRELINSTSNYCSSLEQTIGSIILICDKDNIISVSGANVKEYLGKKVSADLEKMMEDKQALVFEQSIRKIIPLCQSEEIDYKYSAQIISPILAKGKVVGTVIITSKEKSKKFSEIELRLAETAASFLGNQVEC